MNARDEITVTTVRRFYLSPCCFHPMTHTWRLWRPFEDLLECSHCGLAYPERAIKAISTTTEEA